MKRHSIDPLSGALGLVAAGVGIIVAVGRVDSFADDAVWWIAALALLLGVALVPWKPATRNESADVVAAVDHAPAGDPTSSAQRFDVLQLPPADSSR